MPSIRMWASFGLWEVLAGFAATLARAKNTEPVGRDDTILAGVAIGATLLWWSLYFFGTALTAQLNRSN